MKRFLLFALMAVFASMGTALAQEIDSSKTYVVIKNDGTEYTGKILSKDGREILLKTSTVGEIYIPMHEVKDIVEIDNKDVSSRGEGIYDDPFSTRYYITTSAHPVKRGEHYIQWSYWGPDFQFGVADNVGVGVMTSWIGIPIVFNAKYSIPLNEEETTNIAFGTLLGTLSYLQPDYWGALPYASLSFGDRKSNLSVLGGALVLGGDGESYTRPMMGIGGMTKLSSKISLVFETILVLPDAESSGLSSLIIPGLRFQTKPGRSFQFGFTGIGFEGEFLPVPIPMVQFYQKI